MPPAPALHIAAAALVAVFAFCAATPARAERQLALVLGNDSYEHVESLEKAVNDARTIARTLGDLGFEVATAENAGRRDINRVLQEFTARIEPGDVAFFFYAGHGVAIEGRNYLLPTDIPEAEPGQEQFVRSEAIAVDEVMAAIHDAGARIAVLVIDACRDNPFARAGTRSLGGTRGLARVAPPAGSFVMYSAGIGQSALDRLGPDDPEANSVFTRKLAPLLAQPGLTLTETARRVRRDVQALAGTVSHEQRPAYYDEVSGDFFLAGAGDASAAPPAPAPVAEPRPATQLSAAAEAWATTRDSKSVAVLEAFVEAFAGTIYATMAEARLSELKAAEPVPDPARTTMVSPPPAVPAPSPAPAQAPTRPLHYVTGLDPAGDNWLALRTAPGSSGQLIARMGPQTLLEVVSRSGAWLEVVVASTADAGRRGWTFSKYIACCREGVAAVPASAPTNPVQLHYLTGLDPAGDNWLALRSAPDGKGQRIAKMGPETLLQVVGRSGAWLEVVVQNTGIQGYRGWAYAKYIACCHYPIQMP